MPAASRRAGQLPELERPGHARRAAAAARPGWKETARSQRQPRPGLALVDLDAVRRSGAGRRRQFPRPGRADTGQAGPARWWPPAALAGGLQARSRLQKCSLDHPRSRVRCMPRTRLAAASAAAAGASRRWIVRHGQSAPPLWTVRNVPPAWRPISLPQPKPAAQDRCALLLCSRPRPRHGGLTAHGTKRSNHPPREQLP